MTRESFSPILSTLQRDMIHVEGQEIHIRDRSKLLASSAPAPLIDGPDA